MLSRDWLDAELTRGEQPHVLISGRHPWNGHIGHVQAPMLGCEGWYNVMLDVGCDCGAHISLLVHVGDET